MKGQGGDALIIAIMAASVLFATAGLCYALYSSGELDSLLSGKPTYVCNVANSSDPCVAETARIMHECEDAVLIMKMYYANQGGRADIEAKYDLKKEGDKCRMRYLLQKVDYELGNSIFGNLMSSTLNLQKGYVNKPMTCLWDLDEMGSMDPEVVGLPHWSTEKCEGEMLANVRTFGTADEFLDYIGGGSAKPSTGSGTSASGPGSAATDYEEPETIAPASSEKPPTVMFENPEDKFEWAANLGCGYGSHSDYTVNGCLDELYADAKKGYGGTLSYKEWQALRPDVRSMAALGKENRYADYLWIVKSAELGACTAPCFDSDGGKDYDTKGAVFDCVGGGDYVAKADSCIGSTLLEQYCKSGSYAFESHKCSGGCSSDGACE